MKNEFKLKNKEQNKKQILNDFILMRPYFYQATYFLRTILFLVMGSVFFIHSFAQAKELSQRLGVGYMDSLSESLPSLAVRYYPSSEIGLSASLGVDTQKDQSRFGLMGKIHRVVFKEENLNFYIGTGLGILSIEKKGKNESGFEANGFFGTEFFFSGLDSLAFNFEAGVGVTSISSEVRFRTIGESPLKAGVTFYF